MGMLDECGRFSEQLKNIVSVMKNNSVKNGEKVDEKYSEIIELDVFQAYQQILGSFDNIKDISAAISNLEKAVLTSGSNDIHQMSTMVIMGKLNEINNMEFNLDVGNNVAIPMFIDNVMENIPISEKLEKISEFKFDSDVIEDIDEKIEKAKNGDEEAAGKAVVSAVLMKKAVIAKHDESFVENNANRKTLIKRIVEFSIIGGSEEEAKLLAQTANEFGLNIFALDENGKYILNKENLEEVANQNIPNYFKKCKDPAFKEHLIKRNKIAAEKAKIKEKSGQELADIAKGEAIESVIKKSLNKAFSERNEEKICEIYNANPEISKKVLGDMIARCNELKKYSPNSSKAQVVQEKCMFIGSCISEMINNNEEVSKSIPIVPNSSSLKQIERDDDELR